MSEKDFAISVTAAPPVGAISKKPCYLVVMDGTAKTKPVYFIAMDKPDLQTGFIQAKGIFSSDSEDDIVSGFGEILKNTPKESIVDMMFPWHRIRCIRSLVFNANKPSTLVK